MSRPLRTVLVGANGRMGLAIEQAAARTGGFDLIHRVGRENLARLEQDLDGLQADLIVDFSSPNVAKRMHIGHMRSTQIGHALYRLHRAAGRRILQRRGDHGDNMRLAVCVSNGYCRSHQRPHLLDSGG